VREVIESAGSSRKCYVYTYTHGEHTNIRVHTNMYEIFTHIYTTALLGRLSIRVVVEGDIYTYIHTHTFMYGKIDKNTFTYISV